MRLKRKYVSAKLVCEIAESIARINDTKESKFFAKLLRKAVKSAPYIKSNEKPVPEIAEPVNTQPESQQKVLGSVSDFISAIKGDIRTVAKLPSGEIVFDGYLDENINDEFEDLDITDISFRDGIAIVSVKERPCVHHYAFVVIGSNADFDESEEDDYDDEE